MKARIPEFYAGQKILITGGTGFMGKVLIEKLLRCCPDLDKIYLIIREKKGKSIEERWQAICNLPLFDKLKAIRPENLEKVKLIKGDMGHDQLGLSANDQQEILENVTLGFHVAADVQFNENVGNALENNVKATKTFCDFLIHMKQLQGFVYVSTAFSNANLPCEKAIEEVLPACQDWRVLLKLQETEPHTLLLLKEKLMCGHPNPYTWSKSLAEQIVKEYSANYATAIIRPTIVHGILLDDPLAGWADAATGLTAIGIGYVAGVLRIFPVSIDAYNDYINVDIATNGEIIAAKKAAEMKSELQVYNLGTACIRPVTYGELLKIGDAFIKECPFEHQLWAPSMTLTRNMTLFWILFYYKQLLPAAIIDMLFRLIGKEPRLIKINKKICSTVRMYGQFARRSQVFSCDNYYKLEDYLHNEDKKYFSIDLAPYKDKVDKVVRDMINGYLKYFMKLDLSEKKMLSNRARSKRLAMCDTILSTVLYLSFGVVATWIFL